MAWKEIRNGEPAFRNTSNSGICKLSGMQAEVISFFMVLWNAKQTRKKHIALRDINAACRNRVGTPTPLVWTNVL